jgi:hypothetical protein
MTIYQPSRKMVTTPFSCESRDVLPHHVTALVVGAVSQVETTIELTNRICDRYLTGQTRRPTMPKFAPTPSIVK